MVTERIFGLKTALVTLGVLLVDFALFWCWYGGWINYDTLVQWNQVQDGAYTNWHPFVHTFLMMKVPSLIWNDYRVTVLWQILFASGVFGYVGTTCLRCGFSKKATALVLACVLLHPQTLFFLMSPLKDSAFALAVLMAMAALVRIVRTHGEGLTCRSVWMPLAIGLALAMLFRHNGIFFSGMALLLLLALYLRRWTRPVLFSLTVTVLLYGGLRWGLGGAMNVQPASQHMKQYMFIESAGLPLTLMGAVYVRHPEAVSPAARKIFDSIRSQEIWQKHYQDGSFNVVKHEGVCQLTEEMISRVHFEGWGPFFRVCWQTLSTDPCAAGTALVRLTDQVWSPMGGVHEESLRFPLRKIGLKGDLTIWLKILQMVAIPLLGVCACVTWCLVATFFWAVWRRKWGMLLLALPVLCYNFGTMCFLSGFNMARLFFCNVFVAGFLVLMWYGRNRSPSPSEIMV